MLCEVMSYYEEAKKKKKPKKGAEPEPEPPIDKTPETIRYYAMQIMASFAKEVLNYEHDDKCLIEAFSRIPNLLPTLCKSLCFLHPSLSTDIPDEEKSMVLRGCKWLLQSLHVVLCHQEGAVGAVLTMDGFLGLLKDMWTEPTLTLPALLIVQRLSSHPAGLVSVQEEDILQSILHVFEESCVACRSAPDPAVTTTTNKAKVPPKGKGAPTKEDTASNHTDDPEGSNYVGLAAVCIKYFVALAQSAPEAVRGDDIRRIVGVVAPVLLNQEVITQCNAKSTHRQDPDLKQFVRESVILMGSCGVISEEVRRATVESGAVRVVLNLLDKSRAVFGAGLLEELVAPAPTKGGKGAPAAAPVELVEATPEALAAIYEFRHVCEKALLHLLTVPTNEVVAESLTGSSGSQWPSCRCSVIDVDALGSSLSPTTSSVDQSNASVLVGLVKHIDPDVSNRAIRLLSVVMHSAYAEGGVEDGVAAFGEMGLDNVLVENLTAVLLLRAVEAARDIDDRKAQETAAAEAEAAAEVARLALESEEEEFAEGDGVDEVKSGEGEVGDELSQGLSIKKEGVVGCAPSTTTAVNKISLLSSQQVLSHAVCILTYFLHAQSAHVNIFASREMISALAGLLYRCGPVSGAYLLEGITTVTAVEEAVVSLLDPREYFWNQNEASGARQADTIIIREVVFHALSAVASADVKYREYPEDAELPQPPGKPFPESTCPCADQAMHVFKSCSNPCVAILMCRSTFKLEDSHINAAPSQHCDKDTNTLCKPVCEAALRLLIVIASAGMRGLGSLYAAIAQKSTEVDADAPRCFVPAMRHLKDFFHHKVLPMQPVNSARSDGEGGGESLRSIDAAYDWKVPILCELDCADDDGLSPTHHLHVLHRKDLWPFFTVAGALLGLLSNPQTEASTMSLAVNAVQLFSRVSNIHDAIQPALADIFSGCLLGMGGVVALGGCMGRFGPLVNNDAARNVLSYVIDRGHCRESFWTTWKENHPAEVDEVVKGGKGGKKDTKSAGKKDTGKKGAAPASGSESEIALPFEPDDSHIDPNHGPTVVAWRSLLNTSCDDLHGSSANSHPLVACIQGGLSDTANQLIAAGAVLDQGDENGVTPLEHSIVLGDYVVASALIAAGADVDCLDAAGNAAIKYAFFSLSSDTWNDVFDICRDKKSSQGEPLSLLGGVYFVEEMVQAGVDLNVCDSDGNHPLHHAVGVGHLSYSIGGVTLSIRSNQHVDGKEISTTLLDLLVNGGAPVSAVNAASISPLHVLAALGDVCGVATALKHGAVPNVQDSNGYMPIHYATSTCSPRCIETVDVLLKKSILRPCFRQEFDNTRTGKTKSEKYEIDSQRALQQAVDEATCPAALRQKRLTLSDILRSYSDNGLTPSLLALCGNVLGCAPHHACLVTAPATTSEARVRIFYHLDKLYDGPSADLVQGKDESNTGLPSSLAFALLVADERRANGSDSAESLFTALSGLLDICFNHVSYDPDVASIMPVLKLNLPQQWTVLHAAIISDSDSFLDYIWDSGPNVYKYPYVHFIAGMNGLSEKNIANVLHRASLSPVNGTLLNTAITGHPQQPLHIGTAAGNIPFLKCMLALPQVEVNVIDAKSGRTPFHVACAAEDVDMMNMFLDYRDDVDILVRDTEGENCVDTVLRLKSVGGLQALLDVKRMDVIEQLLATPTGGHRESMLIRLERENVALCRLMNIFEPSSAVTNDDGENVSAVEGTGTDEPPEGDLASAEDYADAAPAGEEASAVEEVDPPEEPLNVLRDDEIWEIVAEYKDPKSELLKSNQLLQLIISLLHELNVVDADVHVHECFHRAVLYHDHCMSPRPPVDEVAPEVDMVLENDIEQADVDKEEQQRNVTADEGVVEEQVHMDDT